MKYIIVGFGNIGHKRAKVLGNKLSATVDPNSDVGADYKDSKEVPLDIFDTAVLTVPQQVKYELTEYFLSKGKNVLVEKPLIITPKQGKKLRELSKKTGAVWHTSYNHRFEPNILKFEKLVASGFLGKIYHGRFVYSFGNIQERVGTWRETEFGVLEEIAPHLIDFLISFFDYKGKDFESFISHKNEAKIYDHFTFVTSDKKMIVETSSVTWKYQFLLEVFGSKGSLHLQGLRKWGGSKLIKRARVLPTGAPKEEVFDDSGEDQTWEKDFKYFETLVKGKKNSLKKDSEMSLALAKIAAGGSEIYEEILEG